MMGLEPTCTYLARLAPLGDSLPTAHYGHTLHALGP
jgi:hypothetical protein